MADDTTCRRLQLVTEMSRNLSNKSQVQQCPHEVVGAEKSQASQLLTESYPKGELI